MLCPRWTGRCLSELVRRQALLSSQSVHMAVSASQRTQPGHSAPLSQPGPVQPSSLSSQSLPYANTIQTPRLYEALNQLCADGPRYYVKATIKNRTFTLTKGDTVLMHRLKGPQVGDLLRLTQLNEIGSKHFTLKGHPYLSTERIVVRVRVMEHGRGSKVAAKEGKQRKGRRKKVTIKPLMTRLKVVEIALHPPS